MTREEAIHILRDSKPSISFGDHDDKVLERVANVCFAIDMAIEALKGQKVGKWRKEVDYGNNEESWVCTYCGGEGWHTDKYCSECGAKMEGAEE